MKKGKKNNILVIIVLLITIYLMLRTSYCIIYDNANIYSFFSIFLKRLYFIPWKICFHPISLFWLGIYILIIVWHNYYKLRPKPDWQWHDKEHGSNAFQTKETTEEFLEKCTDNIIPFTKDDIEQVLIFLGETKQNE